MTGAEKISNGLAALALVVSSIAFYFTSCQPADLRIGLSESILLNAKPRIGLLASVQNDGARAGGFVSGALMWDSIQLDLVMVSPKIETWTYPAGGVRKNVEETQFTFVAPVHIQPHTSEPAMLWFTRTESAADRLFTSGTHSLQVRLLDGVGKEPVARRNFQCALRSDDIANIYAKGSEITEFRIRVVLVEE